MSAITESTVKKFWAVIVIVAGISVGGAVWATKVSGDIDALKAAAAEQKAELREVASEIVRLRLAMVRAGTAAPEPGEGR